MINTAIIKNFTVFSEIQLDFGKNLNVFIGENGTGKTHLLKLLYSVLASSAEEGRKNTPSLPTKTLLQTRMAEKLTGVFRAESLGRLTRRKPGRERCDVEITFTDSIYDIQFSFSTNSKTEVVVEQLPESWIQDFPVYFPTRELMSIFPGFLALYESRYLEFEETWRDLCLLLGAPLQKGPKEQRIKELLEPLEKIMEGSIEFDKNGRFYLKNANGRMEMPLVAEGLRKLSMLARLIATGTLLDKGYFFWDEPEANLNSGLIGDIVKTILKLSKQGIQVFIATHSLFLIRELDILKETNPNTEVRYFGLHKTQEGVDLEQGADISDIGDISALDAELKQADRFMALAD